MSLFRRVHYRRFHCSPMLVMVILATVARIYCLWFKFTENCIGAKVFMDMTNEDIDSKELNFSFGGKLVLKRLKKAISKI